MSKPMETYRRFAVVKVPFPFVDVKTTKRRPALILSLAKQFNAKAGASVVAMITSIKPNPGLIWPLDIEILDSKAAGLPVPSLVRMKLFTLDHRLILGQLGILSTEDQQRVNQQLRILFGINY